MPRRYSAPPERAPGRADAVGGVSAAGRPAPRPTPARRTRRPRRRRRRPGSGRSRGRTSGRGSPRATVPSKRVEPLLERLGRLQVEVVGGLVEQQQGRPGQLEQQDLEPRLLAARERLEPLLRRRAPARSGRARRRPASRPMPVAVLVAAVQDLEQRPPQQRRGARGSARTSPGARASPSRTTPVCATGDRRTSPTGRCSTFGVAAAGTRAAAGSATCPSRWSRARRPARRTRPRGRTASSGRSARGPSQTTARLAGAAAREAHRHLLLVGGCLAAARPPRTSRSRVCAAW